MGAAELVIVGGFLEGPISAIMPFPSYGTITAMSVRGPEIHKERMGRVLKDTAEDRAYKRMLSARGAAVVGRRHGGGSGGRGQGASRTSSARQVVFKVLSHTKSFDGVTNMVDYVGRNRAQDRANDIEQPVMRDENGTAVAVRDAHRRLRDTWDLRRDHENLSKVARAATPEQRREMTNDERLYRRQAAHLMVSLQMRDEGDARAFEMAMLKGVHDLFGAGAAAGGGRQFDNPGAGAPAGGSRLFNNPGAGAPGGRPALWAIHTDHGGDGLIHAHILVATKGHDGRQMRIGRRELLLMRGYFTAQMQDMGLEVEATQREDRPDLRDAIATGREPLRKDTVRQPGRDKPMANVMARAPDWAMSYGVDYTAERSRILGARVRGTDSDDATADKTVPPPGPDPLDMALPKLTAKMRRRRKPKRTAEAADALRKAFQMIYANPGEALESFHAMAAELERREGAATLADWAVANQPALFGMPRRDIPPPLRLRLRHLARRAERPEMSKPQAVPASARERMHQMVERSALPLRIARDRAAGMASLRDLADSLDAIDPALAAGVREEMHAFGALAERTIAIAGGGRAAEPPIPASSGGRTPGSGGRESGGRLPASAGRDDGHER